ncbi:MAG: hypothetical protein JWP97_2641 [Labilithrix sp.]|nr:hypothetical protein [Labilithrix sp.]
MPPADRRAVALLFAAVMATGCRKGGADAPDAAAAAPTATDAGVSDAPSAEVSTAPRLSPAPSPAPLPAQDGTAWLTAAPTAAKSIGHTSVVFRVDLANGKRAVFKPASRRGPLRYKGEIAAYRLGLWLGMDDVTPAFFRTFDEGALSAAAGTSGAGELFTRDVLARGGVVKGAVIPWIDKLGFMALEREPLASEWKAWLRSGASIPEDRRMLAAQISRLVAFDFLTGNWDRWSGGNVGQDPATGRLLVIDNDGAFFEVPPADGLARSRRLLAGIDRFSRAFADRVRALDEASLTAAIGEESAGTSLLSKKALEGVLARRKELLVRLDAAADDGFP